MLLPKSGAWVEFERHASHRLFPTNTIHIVTFWASESDKLAGKPGVRWDATLHWNGPQDPGPRLIRHLDGQASHALTPSLPGAPPHLDPGIVSSISDQPDTHGILAHPSMAAFQPTAQVNP